MSARRGGPRSCIRAAGCSDMADLTEQSLVDLMETIKRDAGRTLVVKPTHIHWPVCPTCDAACRYDGPYWMCDNCKRVVGQDLVW